MNRYFITSILVVLGAAITFGITFFYQKHKTNTPDAGTAQNNDLDANQSNIDFNTNNTEEVPLLTNETSEAVFDDQDYIRSFADLGGSIDCSLLPSLIESNYIFSQHTKDICQNNRYQPIFNFPEATSEYQKYFDSSYEIILAELDYALNKKYQEVMNFLNNNNEVDTRDYQQIKNDLISSQRLWVTYHKKDCELIERTKPPYYNSKINVTTYTKQKCLQDSFYFRTFYLEDLLKNLQQYAVG
jgi:uncharacterized protein YecT (DUF1311 family)